MVTNFFKALFGTQTKAQNSIYSLAFLEAPNATLITDEHGFILHVNESFSKLTGFIDTELIGHNMSHMKSNQHDHSFYTDLWLNLLSKKQHNFEIWNRCSDNSHKLFLEKVSRLTHQGEDYFIISLDDITKRTRFLQQQKHLATHDSLTGLANRSLLLDRFEHAAANAKRTNHKLVLLMCDLDNFKKINDTYGHLYGDKVLQGIANQFRCIVRDSDTIARYGGDEFVILLENIHSQEEIKRIASDIKNNFPIESSINGKLSLVDTSIGYACFPDDGENFETLMHKADTQMYTDKFACKALEE